MMVSTFGKNGVLKGTDICLYRTKIGIAKDILKEITFQAICTKASTQRNILLHTT